jgi:hypothetical protein
MELIKTSTNNHPQAIRLYKSMCRHLGQTAAERLAREYPLSKSADTDRKTIWADGICACLEKEFDDETIQKVRMDCACGPGPGKMNNLRKLYQSSDDAEDFVGKVNRLNQGFTLRYETPSYYLTYPQCYCSFIKRSEKPISKTWCYCTLGYTKRMFEYILEKEVVVALLQSVKDGGEKCDIRIT